MESLHPWRCRGTCPPGAGHNNPIDSIPSALAHARAGLSAVAWPRSFNTRTVRPRTDCRSYTHGAMTRQRCTARSATVRPTWTPPLDRPVDSERTDIEKGRATDGRRTPMQRDRASSREYSAGCTEPSVDRCRPTNGERTLCT